MFPRLTELRVSGYEPYTNEHHSRIDHAILPGVNVIVGINGLGKTTLLNIVFRMLVGPYDPSKADLNRPGRAQASLTRQNNFDFFRKRANDEAVEASATATFLFGDRRLEITRSLRDLSLVGYSLDGHEVLASADPVGRDEELMDRLAQLMGFDVEEARRRGMDHYRYDFDFVVRNLVFFLEDKIPLIWNPVGQFVVLRILLVEQDLSERIAKARNELLQADSQYRNRLWAANKLRSEIEESGVQGDVVTEDVETYKLAASRVTGLEQRREDLLASRTELAEEIDRIENSVLQARVGLFDAQRRVQNEEASFFQQAFDHVRTPGDLVLQALASRQGCLVCGTSDVSVVERARELIAAHQCPVCESETKVTGDNVVAFGEAVLERLKSAEAAADKAAARIANLERAAVEATNSLRETTAALEMTVVDLGKAKREERTAEFIAAQAEEVRRKREELGSVDAEVAQLKATLKALVGEHEALIKESSRFIEVRKSAIIEAFEEYASAFMVEDCRLRFRADARRKVAQSDDPIDWPAFEVDLASGADAAVTERKDAASVSESQKEFIDLAFRMALLRVASDGGASMLAVETPEASLDAFFLEQAGRLLRNYAEREPGNVLLVSSNLTGGDMIAQLLGTKEGLEDPVRRRARTLNLLEYARPTKAYRSHQKFYDDWYEAAVGGLEAPQPEEAQR